MGSDKVTMPMSSAGIVGYSPDIRIGGKEMDPKMVLIAVVVLVLIVQIASFAFPA